MVAHENQTMFNFLLTSCFYVFIHLIFSFALYSIIALVSVERMSLFRFLLTRINLMKTKRSFVREKNVVVHECHISNLKLRS